MIIIQILSARLESVRPQTIFELSVMNIDHRQRTCKRSIYHVELKGRVTSCGWSCFCCSTRERVIINHQQYLQPKVLPMKINQHFLELQLSSNYTTSQASALTVPTSIDCTHQPSNDVSTFDLRSMCWRFLNELRYAKKDFWAGDQTIWKYYSHHLLNIWVLHWWIMIDSLCHMKGWNLALYLLTLWV